MAESTLALGRTDLRSQIAVFLGYSRTSTDWSTEQGAKIDQALNEGTAKFYNEREWSFLSPSTTLTCTADDYAYDLSDDFGGMREDFYFAADKTYRALKPRSVGFIRQQIALSDSSGIPQFYAVNPKSQTGVTGTRWEVLFYPPPNAAFVFTYRYTVLRDALSASYPYPAGSAATRNAILWACLSAADALFNDSQGLAETRYQDYLRQAVDFDGRLSPTNLGKLQDTSAEASTQTPGYYSTYDGSTG